MPTDSDSTPPSGTMHAVEEPIDAPLVRRLLTAQFPHWAHLPLTRFPSSGTVNAVYRLGDDLAVRLPRVVTSGVEDIEKEQRWLPRLAPLLPVAVPVVLGKGVPGEGYPWPWSVHRWLEGDHPDATLLARSDGTGDDARDEVRDDVRDISGANIGDSATQLALDLAEFITALRRVDPTDAPPAYRGAPLATEDDGVRAAIRDLRGDIDTGAATGAWEAALAAPDWSGPPLWLHSDLMPGNLLLSRGRLSGVIDFETVGVGDPACDLIVAWNPLPARVRHDFRVAVGLDDATWARGRGWALAMALIQLPYYRDRNPVIAGHARHVIREVLTEHRAGDHLS
ncbi:aminoglycoside phosphotransferase family protein [Streptomyces sp. NPDC058001]|uniref:aminoglycoside phosphotransferase family protein n=1 Tax=Streptomyces sp. NPDC058001 TaxID=3346300 RepID=UPI0036F1738F